MNKRANQTRVIPIVALLTLVLFKFQNCAPVGTGSMSANDPGVGLIDGWDGQNGSQRLSFLSPTYLLAGLSQPLTIHGICLEALSDNRIVVQILNSESPAQVLESQEVECVMGGFEVSSITQTSISCSDRWHIVATSLADPKHQANTEVQVDCRF